MVEEKILDVIRDYLYLVNQAGIHTNRAVIFGSWAKGEEKPESDIDLVVLAPEFDQGYDRDLISQLWELRVEIPGAWRIEPIACGEREWLEDTSRAVIEIARREGKVITREPEVV
ncbi:MAG: nucleotidyltransferase domain-containing protein [Anaerolineae bacterium]|nr:nucleotidyltransferase domain-containing protein [Anaerolineae bacterium]MCB0222534.1 nucleotidyltransferase domain-containing protein [Anaerolineae bacterium]